MSYKYNYTTLIKENIYYFTLKKVEFFMAAKTHKKYNLNIEKESISVSIVDTEYSSNLYKKFYHKTCGLCAFYFY